MRRVGLHVALEDLRQGRLSRLGLDALQLLCRLRACRPGDSPGRPLRAPADNDGHPLHTASHLLDAPPTQLGRQGRGHLLVNLLGLRTEGERDLGHPVLACLECLLQVRPGHRLARLDHRERVLRSDADAPVQGRPVGILAHELVHVEEQLGQELPGFPVLGRRDNQARQVGEVPGAVGEEHVRSAAAAELPDPGADLIGAFADFFPAAQDRGRDLENRFDVHTSQVHVDDDQRVLVDERGGRLSERGGPTGRLGEGRVGEHEFEERNPAHIWSPPHFSTVTTYFQWFPCSGRSPGGGGTLTVNLIPSTAYSNGWPVTGSAGTGTTVTSASFAGGLPSSLAACSRTASTVRKEAIRRSDRTWAAYTLSTAGRRRPTMSCR